MKKRLISCILSVIMGSLILTGCGLLTDSGSDSKAVSSSTAVTAESVAEAADISREAELDDVDLFADLEIEGKWENGKYQITSVKGKYESLIYTADKTEVAAGESFRVTAAYDGLYFPYSSLDEYCVEVMAAHPKAEYIDLTPPTDPSASSSESSTESSAESSESSSEKPLPTPGPIQNLADIPSDTMQQMITLADTTFRQQMAARGDSPVVVSDNCIGYIFYVNEAARDQNAVDLVFETTLTVGGETKTYYRDVEYSGLYITDNYSGYVDTATYNDAYGNGDVIVGGSGGFYGYNTLADVYAARVTGRAAGWTCETNIAF